MTVYDPTFYETIRAGCISSAGAIAPRVHKLLKPTTVLDVGCGEGWWAKAFEELGATVHGIDGDWPGAGATLQRAFSSVDLGEPLKSYGAFDLVTCLEVAEHLSAERAVSFVDDLLQFDSKAVLFSAAVPGQPGAGHVNCQWQSYWAALFEAHGYQVTGNLRSFIWEDDQVEPWYRQNLLLAVSPKEFEANAAVRKVFKEFAMPLDVVHPVIWGWFR
jgi:SAM-dependent methyltransferase